MQVSLEENNFHHGTVYDVARSYFEYGLNSAFLADVFGKSLSHQRLMFGVKESVKLLTELYNEGAVETIEGLPEPKEIDTLSVADVSKLSEFLQQNYFPELG